MVEAREGKGRTNAWYSCHRDVSQLRRHLNRKKRKNERARDRRSGDEECDNPTGLLDGVNWWGEGVGRNRNAKEGGVWDWTTPTASFAAPNSSQLHRTDCLCERRVKQVVRVVPRGVVGAPCPIETERRQRRATPFEEPPLHGLASLALLTWTGGWLRCPKIEVRPKRVLFLHYSLFKRKKNLAQLTWANCWEMDLIDAPTFGKCLNSIRSIFFLFSYWCLLARAIPAYFYGLFLRHCVASVSRYLIKSHYLSMKKEIVLSKCSLNNSLVHAFEKRYQLQKKNA